ncbi:MAG: thioredoxin TrxC [Deltaproteobacteria bacterium]|nr:thioredoxin TrxC [Candidatus Tharpella sp.]
MSESIHLVCSHCQGLNRFPKPRLKEDPRCGKCHTPLLTGQVVDLTVATFDTFINKNELPVVVNFWASWCGHCRNFQPVFEEAGAKLQYLACLTRVESEEEPALTRRFAIKGMPTHILFRAGREVARQSGAMPLAAFMQWLRQSL